MRPYVVKAVWDGDAQVYVATSDDVPGLVAEAETVERLLDELSVLVPELLRANDALPEGDPAEISIQLMSERLERLCVA